MTTKKRAEKFVQRLIDDTRASLGYNTKKLLNASQDPYKVLQYTSSFAFHITRSFKARLQVELYSHHCITTDVDEATHVQKNGMCVDITNTQVRELFKPYAEAFTPLVHEMESVLAYVSGAINCLPKDSPQYKERLEQYKRIRDRLLEPREIQKELEEGTFLTRRPLSPNTWESRVIR